MDTATPDFPQVEVRSRDRIHIRTRESGVTLSAWRIDLSSPRGSIVLVEISGRSIYRGDGALLGATQERLSELWRASLPPDEVPPDNPQLG
jgi:hypothetical protein